ncbi:3-deoxy-D-manno-octulosonic acid transferase [Comamonas sp.]|uniref:3-deoxy-D-manno-octulosonic acid transferase n=1 Tax=Comamonas sp. TaxID=34028 RepID=UPI002899E6CF|nr:3-deoxy-D-manno-octulosonic acid transferase [Comamonas sp.]
MNWSLAAYSVLAWAAQPMLKRKLRRRAQAEPGYAQAVPERFGCYSPRDLGRDGQGQWVWVHAVSLGETRAAALLIKALRTAMPGMRLLLTNGTATGREEGEKLLRPGDLQVWQPWDSRKAVQRFVRQFQPAVGVLMETEVWPNLVMACSKAQVPLVVANARLNTKSQTGAQRWPALFLPVYSALHAVWAQTEEDAQRLRSLGAPVHAVLGNLKFDVEPDSVLSAQGAAWRAASSKPVVIVASSREGEEAQWVAQWAGRQFHGVAGQCQWLIVPRHPQRFDEVHRMLEQAGLRVSRRSQWSSGQPPADVDVWLGDSVGEMPAYYAAADIGLLGGSFEPLGGQNLIEAAACGCPMVLGPHTFNFAQASQTACEVGAAFRVLDMEQGVQLATALARDAEGLARARQAALAFAQTHRGAAQATAQAIAAIVQQTQGLAQKSNNM